MSCALLNKLYRARSGSILSNTGEHSSRLDERRIPSSLGRIPSPLSPRNSLASQTSRKRLPTPFVSPAPSRKSQKSANREGHRGFVGRPCVEGERTNRKAEDWCGEEPAQYTLFYSSERSSTICVNTLRQGLRSRQRGNVQTRRGRTVEEIMNRM